MVQPSNKWSGALRKLRLAYLALSRASQLFHITTKAPLLPYYYPAFYLV